MKSFCPGTVDWRAGTFLTWLGPGGGCELGSVRVLVL